MQEVKVNAINATDQVVDVVLDDDVPEELAQVFGAILSSSPPDLNLTYDVKKVAFFHGLFHNDQMGEYSYEQKTIQLDIDKIAEAAVKLDFPKMDIRFFAFHGILQTMCHEAIHSGLAGTYPLDYGYGRKRTDEDLASAHKKANELMDKLLYKSMNTFCIDADRDDLEFLTVPIKRAAHDNGMERVNNYFYNDYIYIDDNGGIATTWRSMLARLNLATDEVKNLLPLPEIIRDKSEEHHEEMVEEMAVGGTSEEPVEPAIPSFGGLMEGSEREEDFDTSVLEDDAQNIDVADLVAKSVESWAAAEQTEAPAEPAKPATEGISVKELQQAFESIIFRCYQHIYTKCGWDGKGNFTNPAGVLESVYIGDIPNKDIVAEFHSVDEHGRSRVYKGPSDYLKGIVAGRTKLPMFHLVIQVGDKTAVRRLVPQNPNKRDGAGNLKWTAKAVSNGEMLAWVLDPNSQNGPKFTYKLNNNKIIKLENK